MKKRLISLLVALCMAVTLLPVSAITAWAEESGSTLKPLQIWSGYPVLDGITPTTDPDGHNIYTGDGWSYDGTTLDLHPASSTEYDFFQLFPAMEMSPNVNSRLEEMQPLLGEISTTL